MIPRTISVLAQTRVKAEVVVGAVDWTLKLDGPIEEPLTRFLATGGVHNLTPHCRWPNTD